MMLRGRQHWLEVTRTVVSDALAEVSTEIEFALKSIAPGLREGRLRLGMRDLAGLRTRFDELERLETVQKPVEEAAGSKRADPDVLQAAGAVQAADAVQAAGAVRSTTRAPEPIALTNAALVSAAAPDAVARLSPGKTALPKRAGGVGLAIGLVCLIVWTLSPRGFFFGREAGAEWDYHPAAPTPVNHAPAWGDAHLEPARPADLGSLPETSGPATPNISEAVPVKRRTHVRLPLPHPIPSGATAGVAPPAKRHHRHLLGLGKLWHWVRHGHHHSQHDTKSD
jgi:hypothetical protein